MYEQAFPRGRLVFDLPSSLASLLTLKIISSANFKLLFAPAAVGRAARIHPQVSFTFASTVS